MNKIKLTFTIEELESSAGEDTTKFLVPTLKIDDRKINEGFALDMR